MPRIKTLVCVECKISPAKDGRYCNRCRNIRRKEYFKQRYDALGGYEGFKDRDKDYQIRKALIERSSGKCERCNWDKAVDVLQTHHKDRNRKNNDLSNLEFICPTCHIYHHFLEGTGFFHSDRIKFLTE